MSAEIHLIEQTLADELRLIGIDDAKIEVRPLLNALDALIISVTSGAFESQTHMDREMRVRPAVVRALSASRAPRAAYVLEVRTPDEVESDTADDEADETESVENGPDRANRRAWRDQRAAISRALSAVGYTVDMLEDDTALVASRKRLSDEKILIGFASSPNSKSIDVDVKKVLQTARQSVQFSKVYYIAPHDLSKPFATGKADWLTLASATTFLHILNSSEAVAGQLAKEASTQLAQGTSELRGPVVTPAIRIHGEDHDDDDFFEYFRNWSRGDAPSLVVLMAPAGHGKTTSMLELTRRFAEAFLDDPTLPLPLFVPFEQVRRTVDFEALMHKRLAELQGSYPAFRELLRTNNAVLFVDGFDELADDAGFSAAENQVRSIRSLLGGRARVVLAGRTAFARQFSRESDVVQKMRALVGEVDVRAVEIMPFDIERVEDFVKTRAALPDGTQNAVLQFAKHSSDHLDLCSSPLLLRFICELATAKKLPDPQQVISGVDSLIDRVCEREEVRQQLSIGTAAQVEYLSWVAQEAFARGGSIPRDDAYILAMGQAEASKVSGPEVVIRLLDHAFLVQRADGRVTLIHPLIRDVLIGRGILEHLNTEGLLSRHATIAARDLPEGTIHYLARHRGFLASLPKGWLTETQLFTSTTRRNLVRVAVAAAPTGEDPRVWLDQSWVSAKPIRGLDLSNLSFTDVSFDGLQFLDCDFMHSTFLSCDFRDTKLNNCDFSMTWFGDCRASQQTQFKGGHAEDATVRDSETSSRVMTGAELLAALGVEDSTACDDVHVPKKGMRPTQSVREAITDLLLELLRSLVDADGTHFHRVSTESLRASASGGAGKKVVDRVLLPFVANTLCQRELAAGSREKIIVAKHWRAAVSAFVESGRPSYSLTEALVPVYARAARYLS